MALILNSSNIIPCRRFFTGSSSVLVSSSSPAAQYVSTTTIAVFVTAPTPVTRLHMKSPPKPKCFSVVMKQRACIIVVKASSSSGIDGGDATSSTSSSSSTAAVPVENLPLESKLQVKVDQKLRMKLAKKMRLRRKRLVRKRQRRKKGRWPPSKSAGFCAAIKGVSRAPRSEHSSGARKRGAEKALDGRSKRAMTVSHSKYWGKYRTSLDSSHRGRQSSTQEASTVSRTISEPRSL